MADKKSGTEQKENSSRNNDNLQGRVDNTANPDFQHQEDQSDISNVDQQEGTMDNGALGGNFDSKDSNR